MSLPEPVTPLNRDTGRRALSAFDLERTIAEFLFDLLDGQRLDNPTVNLAQPNEVPFDGAARSQTLIGKQPPQVVRGRIPRTVTGEINADALPQVPSVIVQVVSGRYDTGDGSATLRMLVTTYDENPDGQGYQDCLNLTETITNALCSFGQTVIDKAYSIVLPCEWKMIEPDSFPHYLAEITTQWMLPASSPYLLGGGHIPGESLRFNIEQR